MGRKGIRGLKTRVGPEHCIAQERPDGPSSTVEVYKLEEEVTVFSRCEISRRNGDAAGRAASGVKAA